MDARFDVTDLNEEERGALCLEVVVQRERSEGHPSVEVEVEWNEACLYCAGTGYLHYIDGAAHSIEGDSGEPGVTLCKDCGGTGEQRKGGK
jgi:hypothetical protein